MQRVGMTAKDLGDGVRIKQQIYCGDPRETQLE